MIDAAHEAVWFDAAWAINSRRDFRRAVRTMMTHAIAEGRRLEEEGSGSAVPAATRGK